MAHSYTYCKLRGQSDTCLQTYNVECSLAVNAIRHPSTTVVDASTIINDLSALQTATVGFSESIYRLFRNAQACIDNLTPIEKYYALSQIKPLLRPGQTPLNYEQATAPTFASSAATHVCYAIHRLYRSPRVSDATLMHRDLLRQTMGWL